MSAGRAVAGALTIIMSLAAVGARLLHVPPTVVFVIAAVAMGLLAWLVGVATEELGAAAGPKVSGVLNASFGNLAEVIVTVFALRAGLTTLVKASITGSILGNTLLVFGLSLILAGVRHGELRFSRTMATTNSSLLIIAVVGLAVPAVFASSAAQGSGLRLEDLSLGVAGILLVAYVLGLIFFFRTPSAGGQERARVTAEWRPAVSASVLAAAAVGLAAVSDTLVEVIGPTLSALHLSELFAGIVIIPLIGNISENVVGVQQALHNDMDFSMVISLGSSLQVALFVAPLLVFLSLVVGHPLTLVFTPLELVTVGFAALILAIIAADGESNWLEGVELVAVYAIVATAFFFYPG